MAKINFRKGMLQIRTTKKVVENGFEITTETVRSYSFKGTGWFQKVSRKKI